MERTQELDGWLVSPHDIRTATWDRLKAIVSEHQFRCFVWENDEPGFEPLMIDAFTANIMVQIHDAMNKKNQAKFERMVAAGRGSFARLVEFSWDHA